MRENRRRSKVTKIGWWRIITRVGRIGIDSRKTRNPVRSDVSLVVYINQFDGWMDSIWRGGTYVLDGFGIYKSAAKRCKEEEKAEETEWRKKERAQCHVYRQ